jgi:ADP-ribose pyrophosphatase YjhB (NUDIX family)
MTGPRLAVRGVIVHAGRVLLVNAWPGGVSDLWCAPGGGVEVGQALAEALRREVHEETGLAVTVGAPCLVNEFHDPDRAFHQVEVFFRCTVASDALPTGWRDPEGVVSERRWFTRAELAGVRFKPGLLAEAAFGAGGMLYDPLERIVR